MERFLLWLKRLREKPDEVKKRIALGVSGVVMLIIIAIWSPSAFNKNQDSEVINQKNEKAQSVDTASVGELGKSFTKILDAVNTLKEFNQE